MPQAPDLTDAEIGELDDLLAAVPAPLQALDVVMLDGYLCGVLAQPEILPPEAWMPPAFDWNLGDGDSGAVLSPDTPGWHAAKHERLTTLTLRRHAHLAAVMTDPGWFDPIVMTPADDEGRPLPAKAAIEAALGPWVIGFEHALNHFTGLEVVPALEVADLLACVRRHLPDQDEEEQAETAALDQEHPLKSLDAAIEDLVGNVIELADLARAERVKVVTVRREAPKVGRNDPCPCGSGRKFKQCHGRSEGGAAP